MLIAFRMLYVRDWRLASARICTSGGRISQTAPTSVDTQSKPVQAASMMAIPNDSVSEGFTKISA